MMTFRWLIMGIFLHLATAKCFAQVPPMNKAAILLQQGDTAGFRSEVLRQNAALRQMPAHGKPVGIAAGNVNVEWGVQQAGGNPRLAEAQTAQNPQPARAAQPARKLQRPARPPQIPNTLPSFAPPSCYDTSGHMLITEPNGYIGVEYLTKTRDGNILAASYRNIAGTPSATVPYLIKYTPQGNVLWARSFGGPGDYPVNYAFASRCFELNDGTLLMVGGVDIPQPVNGRTEFAMWKLGATGNLIWSQTYSGSFWTQYSGSLNVRDMAQDAAGNIYLAGEQFAFDANPTHTFALKMDPAGNIVWDKNFASRASFCFGIMMTGGSLSMVGINLDGNSLRYLWLMKMNPANGDTLSVKAWYPDYGSNSFWNGFTPQSTAVLLANGNIKVAGVALADFAPPTTPITHGLMLEFDPSFNYVQGWMVRSDLPSNYYNSVFTPHPSGRVSYTYMTYVSSYDEDIVYGAIEKGQIIKERIFHGRNRAAAWTSNFVNLDENEDALVQTFSEPIANVSGHEFVRLHDSDTSTVCSGHDSSLTWLETYAVRPNIYYSWDAIISNGFQRTSRTMPAPVSRIPSQQIACKVNASCNFLSLEIDNNVVCAGAPVTLTVHRNPECGSRPLWLFDTTNLQSSAMLNDSMIRLVYRDQYNGSIAASLTGTCSSLGESQALSVLPAAPPVSLGPDSWLCPDSVLVLRPAKGYSTYQWQDGSAADTLIVTAPGTYTVAVTNTCGTPSSDEVVVQRDPGLTFTVNPSATICLNDPVGLNAPNGYSNYSWTNETDGTIYTLQNVTVKPTGNTTYLASAKTSVGCSVKSQTNVTVIQPLPVSLGKDISFCKGDSVLLDPGTGFVSYQWNNGATTGSIYAHSQGTYSVKVQSPNGCYSADTLQVLKIYSLPAIQLDKDDWLCEGSTRTLDAGNGYSSYLWQDGSSQRSFTASSTGTYWVKVVDNNNCANSDTVVIRKELPLPSGFLVPDTIICNGFPSKIVAKGQYSSYNWSTGETKNFITVKEGGDFYLTVTDKNGCSARENISITTKQCLLGIYFPNAFSPNTDGKNDVYKPYVLGIVDFYQLQIFNRWGQLVFATEDYTQGWNGTIKNQQQQAGAYVWRSRYKFAGEPEKQETGTLLLIR